MKTEITQRPLTFREKLETFFAKEDYKRQLLK
jgi:hypothetical protein